MMTFRMKPPAFINIIIIIIQSPTILVKNIKSIQNYPGSSAVGRRRQEIVTIFKPSTIEYNNNKYEYLPICRAEICQPTFGILRRSCGHTDTQNR